MWGFILIFVIRGYINDFMKKFIGTILLLTITIPFLIVSVFALILDSILYLIDYFLDGCEDLVDEIKDFWFND